MFAAATAAKDMRGVPLVELFWIKEYVSRHPVKPPKLGFVIVEIRGFGGKLEFDLSREPKYGCCILVVETWKSRAPFLGGPPSWWFFCWCPFKTTKGCLKNRNQTQIFKEADGSASGQGDEEVTYCFFHISLATTATRPDLVSQFWQLLFIKFPKGQPVK